MKIQDAQTLGQAIRQQRRRLKVTQNDLAMASGTGLRFIIDLEKCKRLIRTGQARHPNPIYKSAIAAPR
jgi:HTH-type transcriptional regulator / antitoxin HipB